MMSGIADALVYSERSEVTKSLTEVLRKKGVANLVITDSREACVDNLKRFAKALLIVDWEMGHRNVVGILTINGRQPHGRQRPMMLIASQVTTQIVAICAEYQINQVFSEAPTPKNFSSRLTALLIGETTPDDVKKTLSEVAEMRGAGSLSDAATVLKISLKKQPHNLRLKSELADLLILMEEPEQAIEVLRGVADMAPPYLRGLHLLGRGLLKLGRFEESLLVLSKAQIFNPDDSDRLVDIGHAFLQMERFKEAKASFDSALEIEPKHKQAKVGKSQVMLMDGSVNEALSILKETTSAIELASLFNTCAVMNIRKGKLDAGMNLYQSALVAVGPSPKLKSRLYFNMGLGYRRMGKRSDALDAFEKAKSFDPSFSRVDQQIMSLQKKKLGAHEPSIKSKVVPDRHALVTVVDEEQDPVFDSSKEDSIEFTTDFNKLWEGDLEESLFSNSASVGAAKTKGAS